MVLVADDVSVIANNQSLTDFERDIKVVYKHMNEWFSVNWLSLV
jgi:hypothetical protein